VPLCSNSMILANSHGPPYKCYSINLTLPTNLSGKLRDKRELNPPVDLDSFRESFGDQETREVDVREEGKRMWRVNLEVRSSNLSRI